MSATPSPTTPTTPTHQLHGPHSFLTRVPTSTIGELQRVASSRHETASRTSTRHGNEGSAIEETENGTRAAAEEGEAEAQTLAAPPPLSSGRKWALLAIFSFVSSLSLSLVVEWELACRRRWRRNELTEAQLSFFLRLQARSVPRCRSRQLDGESLALSRNDDIWDRRGVRGGEEVRA